MKSGNVIAAFSEDQASRLTGVTPSQLRYWDRSEFYQPSYAEETRRVPFSRVYSFKDIVALRVLNVLRNQYSVSLHHLRDVSRQLSHLNGDRWTGVRLYVLNKRVIWEDPETALPQEIVSKQYVVPTVSLEAVVADTKRDVDRLLRKRDKSKIGTIERNRYVSHNVPVIAGTRIPVNAIKRFADAGYTVEQIIQEYPDLTAQDVAAALKHRDSKNAA